MIVDLVLKDGRVVTHEGVLEGGWVAVQAEHIVAYGGPTIDPPPARDIIDIAGNLLLPGPIDPHTHPGNYGMFRDELASESRSAALGGLTTILGIVKSTRLGGEFKPQVSAEDVGSYLDVFAEGRECVERSSALDVAFTFVVMGDLHASEIPRYAEDLGVTSFKFFPSATPPTKWHASIGMPSTGDDGTVYLGLRNIAQIQGLASFHAENSQVVRVLEKEVRASGFEGLEAWARRSPGFLEAYDVCKMAFFARHTGATIYPVHVNSREGVAEIARVKRDGTPIYGETCVRYLVLSTDYAGKPYTLAKVTPPLRDRENQEALWQGLRDGTLDTVGSDHSPMNLQMKATEQGIWGAKAGFGDVGSLFPLMVSEGFTRGRISLERLAKVCCENPARAFGLYPRKGVIQVGSDADLVVIDPSVRRRIRADELGSIADFTPYEGMEVQGWPVLTLLRGRPLLRNGELVGPPRGRYLPRGSGSRKMASVEV